MGHGEQTSTPRPHYQVEDSVLRHPTSLARNFTQKSVSTCRMPGGIDALTIVEEKLRKFVVDE